MAVLALLLPACAPYRFGAATLFPPGIRTVYLPMPRNDTFRHDLGPILAESLTREIETRTPCKVTGNPTADTALTVRIVDEIKDVTVEAPTDDPRALDLNVTVQASWVDRAGNALLQTRGSTAPPIVTIADDQRFVPEGGQSVGSAQIRLMDRLARKIVDQMETRW